MVFLGYDHGYGIPGMGPWEDVHNQGGAHCQGEVPVRGHAQRVQVQGDDLGVRDHRDCDRVGQWTAVLREGHDGGACSRRTRSLGSRICPWTMWGCGTLDNRPTWSRLPGLSRTQLISLHLLDGAQMSKALMQNMMQQVYVITQV